MDVGIGIPSMFSSLDRELLLTWAMRADEAGFSSLSAGERIAFGNHDLVVTMAMVGAVTEQIRLMPTVLAAPLHRTTMLAKQAATLDVLTRGRFVLGVGISERPDDFTAMGVPYKGRGERFEAQLHELRRIWRGDPVHGAPPVGPSPYTPGGPPIVVGAFVPAALRRAGRLADGLSSFHFSPEPSLQRATYDVVLDSWREAARPGRPRWIAGTYFALGPDAPERAHAWIREYYGYLPVETQDFFVSSVTTTSEDEVRTAIDRFSDAGADELYFSPMIPELDQVDRLAALLPGRR